MDFVNQAETNPAGVVFVLLSVGWNPSSSGGIPNSINLLSYTRTASLYALVACANDYLRFLSNLFLPSRVSSIFLDNSSTNLGSISAFSTISWI